MNIKISRARTILLLATILAVSAPLRAQPSSTPPLADPPVTVAAKQTASFEAALQAVTSQAHMTILAEGTPLQRQQPATKLRSLPPHSPVSMALDALAEDYDYDVQRQGNVFVLQKRYSDPNDLPDVTPEECALALDDMAQVMSALSPGPEIREAMGPHINSQLVRIAATLTPAQCQAMEQQTTGQGLLIGSLGDESRSLIRRFVLTNYVYDSWSEVQGTLFQLRQATKATLSVKKSRQVSTRTTRFGDEPPIVQPFVQDTLFGFDIRDFYGRAAFIPLDEGAVYAAAISDQPPPPPPAMLPTAQAEPFSSGDGYTTLGAVVKGLNARGARVATSAALQPKTLTVYGAGTAAPEQLLKAICATYGLRCVKDEDGRTRLTRPAISVPLTVDGLPSAVRRVLPAPLLRAMHDGELEKENQQERAISQEAPKTQADFQKMWAEQSQIRKKGMAMRSLPYTLHRIAVARLRAAYDAQMAEEGATVKKEREATLSTRHVPVSALPAAARSAFAVAVTTGILDMVIHTLGQKAPAWAADTDACYLVGGLHPDPARPGVQTFSMMVSTPNVDGSLAAGTGTSTDYP